ncbi:MAG: hypothetical protein AAB577_01370 [Patescibacteria group bacterium]
MAIEFLQAQKKQRYLILILTLAVCAILLVVWQGFLRAPGPVIPAYSPLPAPPKIEINWDVLKDTKLQDLKVFEQIPAFGTTTGRSNPFTPY